MALPSTISGINRLPDADKSRIYGNLIPDKLLERFGISRSFIDAENRPLPTLSQALQAGGIHCGFPGNDKETVLRNAVAILDLPPEIDPDFILQVLLAREAMGTTAVGDGIAIPHVRNPILVQLREDTLASSRQCENKRLTVAQDLTWALINSTEFLYRH